MVNKKNRFRDKEKTKNLILQTTTQLINEKGYDNLSTNHIAARAKLAIGTVYYHFPGGKTDIVHAITLRNFEKIVSPNILNNLNNSNYELSLNRLITNHIKHHRVNPRLNIAFEQAFLSNNQNFLNYISVVEEQLKGLAFVLKKLSIFKNLRNKELIERLKLSFVLLESIVHYHTFLTPVFNTDEELVDYLSKLILNTLTKI